MRRLWFTAAGLALVPLMGVGLLRGSEIVGTPAQPAKGAKPAPTVTVVVPEKETTCGTHGTQIEFVESPQAAAKQAKKEGKLVFVLHVSGLFEDPRFT